MEVVGIDVAHGAVGIVDDDLGGPDGQGGLDGGIDVLGHPFAAIGVLGRARGGLVAVDDPRDPLHVDRDEDLERGFGGGLRLACQRGGEQEDRRGGRAGDE